MSRITLTYLVALQTLTLAVSDNSLATSEGPVEYCTMEKFNATCRKDEVVVMETARFGRMRLGRCVQKNYGHVGCAVDILGYMDGKCSGEHVCKFTIPDPEMFKTKPCPGDFASYLEASYSCVKVAHQESRHCRRHSQPLVLRQSVGYVASKITEETDLGSRQCPWVIEVTPGRRINVTLFNFVRSHSMSTHGQARPVNMDVCFDVVQISEGASERKIINLCGRDARSSEVYMSKTNIIKVEFLDRAVLRTIGNFLLKYEAVSCPDVRPPPDAWARREGDTLMISCNTTQERWYLTCSRDNWVGELGNCTVPPQSGTKWSLTHVFSEEEIFPYGILVVVAIGILLGVLIGGILLAIIFILSRRRSQKRQPAHIYRENKENTRILDANNSNNSGSLGTTTLPGWVREAQYSDEGIVRDLARSPHPIRVRPPDDKHVIEAHLHANQHICDVIPTNEAFSTFKPRAHFYESPNMT